MLNLFVAMGVAKLFRAVRSVEDKDERVNKSLSVFAWPLWCAAAAALVLCACATAVAAAASADNYPGGVALAQLHELHETSSRAAQPAVLVHIDAAAAMTGVSRFCESKTVGSSATGAAAATRWTYSKDEHLTAVSQYAEFDYLVTADPAAEARAGFEIAKAVVGFERMELVTVNVGLRLPWVRLVSEPCLWIMRRRDSQ